MARGRFTWTDDERGLLRAAYERAGTGNVGLKELAASLGRLQSNVSREARKLGLTRKGRPQPADARKRASDKATTRMRERPNPTFTTRGFRPTDASRALMRLAARRNVANGTHPGLGPKSESQRAAASQRMTERLTSGVNVYSRARRGRREDLGNYFFRSAWEANYARFLEFQRKQGLIAKWEFESVTFWFENIRRGVRSYTPDFRITEPNGAVHFIEVKGWMDKKSATKLKRMKKYHPDIDLRLVDPKAYRELERKLGAALPGWESYR